MNIGRFFLFIFFLTKLAFAEGVPFKVSSSSLSTPQASSTPTDLSAENEDHESNLINDLKYLAVSNWLQTYLGPRYTQFDKHITPEFAEKYILDYKVGRNSAPSGGLELSGHLDGDALKRWVRLIDSKSKASSQIKPLFILSSNLPGLNIAPSETSNKIKESSIAQLLYQLTQFQFKKLNTQLTPLDSSVGLDSPPTQSSEVQRLTRSASQKGSSLVVWETFSTCPGCPNPRIDIFVYNNENSNLAFVVGDDLLNSWRELNNTEVLKKSLLPIFQQFQTELENVFSEGSIHENSFKIVIENVDSYRTLKIAEAELNRGMGGSSLILKKAANKSAEYELKSSLAIEELGQRIQGTVIPGLKTQVSKADSTTLVLKLNR